MRRGAAAAGPSRGVHPPRGGVAGPRSAPWPRSRRRLEHDIHVDPFCLRSCLRPGLEEGGGDRRSRELKAAGEPDARINAVAAWRDASYFTEAERAALALTEAATRLADRSDPVPDDVWDDAARHYDEPQLAALVLAIASINTWNRLNVATRQISGEWVGQWLATREKDGAAA